MRIRFAALALVGLMTLGEDVRGGAGDVLSHQKIVNTTGSVNDQFARSVAHLGDIDGDGLQEVAVGVPEAQGGAANGEVRIISLNSDGSKNSDFHVISSSSGDLPSGEPAAGDWFGISVEAIGDMDGDGITELAVGAHRPLPAAMGEHAVWILFLDNDGTVKQSSKIDPMSYPPLLTATAMEQFGYSIAALGDLDGDGVVDIAVGDDEDDGICCDDNMGSVWILFLNANGSVKNHHYIHKNSGDLTQGLLADYDHFAFSLEPLGDLDGDGFADLAVGATESNPGGPATNDKGGVWILFLNSNGTVKDYHVISDNSGDLSPGALANSDFFGSSLARISDLDGDGVDELAVGAMGDDTSGTDAGATWILFLNPDGTVKGTRKITGADISQSGLVAGDNFGVSATSCGDLDGNGVDDLALGAHNSDGGWGAVWVLLLDGAHGIWTNLGNDLHGSYGSPFFSGHGRLTPGSTYHLTLVNALAYAPLLLVVGGSAQYTPFKGGVLVPAADLVIAAISDANGTRDIPGTTPSTLPSGVTLYLQYWIVDPAGPVGMAASNAISATTP